MHMELLRPAATTWDLRVLEGLWHAAERYIRLAFLGLDTEPLEHRRCERAHNALLETFRLRDPKRMSLAVLHHLDDNEILAARNRSCHVRLTVWLHSRSVDSGHV